MRAGDSVNKAAPAMGDLATPAVAPMHEDVYREIFENVDAGFCLVRMVFDGERPVDYIFQEVNPAFERFTGLVDAVGKSMRELRPQHEEEWYERYGEVARTGRRSRFELQARALGRWYSVDAFRIGAEADCNIGVLFLDITERKRIERELAESEARFSALADGLPMPVWVLDVNGVMRFVNSAYGDFFGLDISSGTVSAWSELLHPEDLPVFQFELAEALQQQRGMRALVRARRHDGRWRWIEMSATRAIRPMAASSAWPAAARMSPSAARSSWRASNCSNPSASPAARPRAWRG